jgi:HK97 family phage portal protein
LGVFDRIASVFGRDRVTVSKIIDLLNRGNPLISVSRDLYNIPEVRTAINFVSEKIASIPMYHVREDYEGNRDIVNDSVNYVYTVRTNPKQSPQVYMTHVITRLLLANNVFAFPDWDESTGQLRAKYPLPFTQFEFSRDEDGKTLISFPQWNHTTFYYDDIIHYQRFPTLKGGTPTQATGNYVQIVNTLQAQAVKDSESSQRIAALLQTKTALKGPAMKAKLDEFKELFLNSENSTGFGMIGSEFEVKDLKTDKTPLNKDILESIVSYLYNYFDVSKEIINGTASEIQYQQFIERIKPIVWQIEEEDTYKLFSAREIGRNNKIASELLDIEIATLQAKTTFFKEMIFGGVVNRNEVRRRLYMKKGPKELDEYQTSKNFQQALPPGNYTVEEPPKGGDNANGDESTEPKI